MTKKEDSHSQSKRRRIERSLRIAFVILWVTVILAALAWLIPFSETIA